MLCLNQAVLHFCCCTSFIWFGLFVKLYLQLPYLLNDFNILNLNQIVSPYVYKLDIMSKKMTNNVFRTFLVPL